MRIITAILLIAMTACSVAMQPGYADPVSSSALTKISLPNGSRSVRADNIPSNIRELLAKITQSSPNLTQGKSELLVLTGDTPQKSNTTKLRQQVESTFKSDGWNYKVLGREKDIDFFTAIKRNPTRQNVFGFWVVANGNLMLAMTEVFTGKSTTDDEVKTEAKVIETDTDLGVLTASSAQPNSQNNSPVNIQTFNVAASDLYVNVMGTKMPTIPSFPATPKKPGFLRGYVKDSSGKPLQGAYIGIRSTMNGGSYSGASASTDANGYYEIKLPFGAIHLYAAAYTVDYGDIRAAMSLHPADGKLEGFASANGDVENFVLLPYGVTDRDKASDQPNSSATYYGGAVNINYNLAELNNSYAPENYIKENSEIEITLTPESALLDGSAGNSFTIRKNVGNGMFFNIYNIPIGRYTISATLVKGNKPLRMEQSVRNKNTSGITPREAVGKASLIFEPDSAQTVMITPARGAWTPIQVRLFLK